MDQTNKIFYIEFHASDLEKTKAFFENVFGWTFTDYGPDYTSFADGQIAGGFARSNKRSSQAAGGALTVIFNQRLEETLGKRRRPRRENRPRTIFSYPGGRRFHFTEPSGNELAVCSVDP
jgi:predicted enzyme related to lactoylglutathione lyase